MIFRGQQVLIPHGAQDILERPFGADALRQRVDELAEMHGLKTGALIRASVMAPCILAEDLADSHFAAMKQFSEDIGLAFQIRDDLLDVEGDTAVAHYFYTSAYEDNDDKVEVSNGRYTDILVRTEDGWKFISWHGGNDE